MFIEHESRAATEARIMGFLLNSMCLLQSFLSSAPQPVIGRHKRFARLHEPSVGVSTSFSPPFTSWSIRPASNTEYGARTNIELRRTSGEQVPTRSPRHTKRGVVVFKAQFREKWWLVLVRAEKVVRMRIKNNIVCASFRERVCRRQA